MTHALEHDRPDEAAIAAYLSDRLDPIRAHDFELYCLRHPDFARRVELDLLVKTGLRHIHARGEKQRKRHRARIALAVAAGVATIICCGLLLFPRMQSEGIVVYRSLTQVPSALALSPHASVTLIRLRDGSGVRRIVASRQAKTLLVQVSPDGPPGSQGYSMELAFEPAVVAQSTTVANLHTDADGYIKVYLPLALLVGHSLRVGVSPSPAAGAQSLSFRLQIEYEENPSP